MACHSDAESHSAKSRAISDGVYFFCMLLTEIVGVLDRTCKMLSCTRAAQVQQTDEEHTGSMHSPLIEHRFAEIMDPFGRLPLSTKEALSLGLL